MFLFISATAGHSAHPEQDKYCADESIGVIPTNTPRQFPELFIGFKECALILFLFAHVKGECQIHQTNSKRSIESFEGCARGTAITSSE
jgi:hypothetical protein